MRSSVSEGYDSMICSRRGNLRRASSEFIFSAFSMLSTTWTGSANRSGNWLSVTKHKNIGNYWLMEEIRVIATDIPPYFINKNLMNSSTISVPLFHVRSVCFRTVATGCCFNNYYLQHSITCKINKGKQFVSIITRQYHSAPLLSVVCRRS